MECEEKHLTPSHVQLLHIVLTKNGARIHGGRDQYTAIYGNVFSFASTILPLFSVPEYEKYITFNSLN